MIKNIFFDLDGTLLPMDMDEFMKAYFGGLGKKMAPYGYNPDELIKFVWHGTRAMVKNDGSKTNEEAFWDDFESVYPGSREHTHVFEDFYQNEFDDVKAVVVKNPLIPKLIKYVKEMGFRQILATNPLFPEVATRARVKWADLDIEDFEIFTTYEDTHYCKPNLKYYEEVLKRTNTKPEETLMVGNDVDEDMIAEKLGMKVFLITDFVLNKNNKDIEAYPHGTFEDLEKYIVSLKEAEK